MRGRKYPQADRARAVGIASVTSIAEASRQTGIAESTIHQWFHGEEFEELRSRSKDQVAAEWWAGAQKIARTIVRDIETAAVRDRAIALGILIDKLTLMRGEATSRSETRSLNDAFDDHEIDLLREAIAAGTAPEGEASAAVEQAGETGAATASR